MYPYPVDDDDHDGLKFSQSVSRLVDPRMHLRSVGPSTSEQSLSIEIKSL